MEVTVLHALDGLTIMYYRDDGYGGAADDALTSIRAAGIDLDFIWREAYSFDPDLLYEESPDLVFFSAHNDFLAEDAADALIEYVDNGGFLIFTTYYQVDTGDQCFCL